jgi:hypothetical protein
MCCSPAAVGAPTLALGARAANNHTNSGLCQAAMTYFIFLKSVFKQCRKAGGSIWQFPGFPWPLYRDWLSLCYGYKQKCRTPCSGDWVFQVPHRKRTGKFSNGALRLLQSLLGLLHKSYSDSTLYQEALGFLRVSHNYVVSPLGKSHQREFIRICAYRWVYE